jgi:hypothetical protein
MGICGLTTVQVGGSLVAIRVCRLVVATVDAGSMVSSGDGLSKMDTQPVEVGPLICFARLAIDTVYWSILMYVARLLFLAGCLSMVPGAALADAVEDYYALLQAYFKGSHWIPIVVPRGEQIGNVYNIRNLQFVADGKTCFPKLKAPALLVSTIPNAAQGKKINGALALGVKDVAAAEAQLGASDEMSLQFADPHVLAVSAVTLANAFESRKCRFLKSQVEATLSGQSLTGETANLVLGEILFAKQKQSIAVDIPIST